MNNEKKNILLQQEKSLSIILVVTSLFIFVVFLVSAMPLWEGTGFISLSITNGTSTENTTFQVNISLIDSGLNQFNWNWNNTNYTFYDGNLLMMLNFNNFSAIGDNDSALNGKVVDLSIYSKNGTSVNVTYVNGVYGLAGSYDDVTSQVTTTKLIDSATWTYSFWFKTPNINDVNKRPFYVRTGNFGTLVQTETNGIPTYHCGNGASLVQTNLGSSSFLNNTWYFITVTYNGTDCQGYKNGGSTGITKISGFANSSQVILVGAFGFNGSIDSVRLWNRSLSSNEVAELYRINLDKINNTQWYFYANQSLTSDGIYNYYASATDSDGTNQTAINTLYYCYPAPNSNWIIDEGNCISNNKVIGTRTNNVTLTNNYNLTLKGTNLTADAITIHTGSRLTKNNVSILTIA